MINMKEAETKTKHETAPEEQAWAELEPVAASYRRERRPKPWNTKLLQLPESNKPRSAQKITISNPPAHPRSISPAAQGRS